MDGQSLNITHNIIEQLKAVIPQAFSEDKLDIKRLQTLLGDAVNTEGERYNLSWAGKSEAYKVLQTPTTATLIPKPESSIDWENAQHVFIEGENLEVLKVLQKSYYGKIKMIYIDPPYNTGNDSFIYPDKFSETKDEYLKRIGDKDGEGYMTKQGFFRKNNKENGQFHSNWLNMMLPRLFLARNLLREDGVIFVSIDDNEQANLKMLMDEIFGEENFISQIIWHSKYTTANDSKYVSRQHEYILLYAKNKEQFEIGLLDRTEKMDAAYTNPDKDLRGVWKATPLHAKSGSSTYSIEFENGISWTPPKGRYPLYSKEDLRKLYFENRLHFGKDGTSSPNEKSFLTEVKQGKTVGSMWSYETVGSSHQANEEIASLTGKGIFDNPKTSKLIKTCLKVANSKNEDSIILDFFAGSGTTAQAVLELNEEDEGNRKYICVQLSEKTEETSEAYQAGHKTIADITETRIRKVIEKITKERNGTLAFEKPQNLGFRKYTLAHSNFKIWRGDVIDNEEDLKRQMQLFITPQYENAQTLNILWELLTKNGIPLTEKIETITTDDGANIYYTNDKKFAFVLDSFTPSVQSTVLELKPNNIICLDSLFQGRDNDKTNAHLKFEDNGISFKTI